MNKNNHWRPRVSFTDVLVPADCWFTVEWRTSTTVDETWKMSSIFFPWGKKYCMKYLTHQKNENNEGKYCISWKNITNWQLLISRQWTIVSKSNHFFDHEKSLWKHDLWVSKWNHSIKWGNREKNKILEHFYYAKSTKKLGFAACILNLISFSIKKSTH